MEIVTIYTIDFELRQNKNDSAAYWSPSCLLHLSVVRQSCSEEGIKEKRTTVYLSIHFNSLYIHLWMLSNHLSLTFQHLVMVWRWSDADSKTSNCRDNPALLKTNPILFYFIYFLKQELAISILIVLPRRESACCRTNAGSIRLSPLCHLWRRQTKKSVYPPSKCVLSAKPIKCPFTQLLWQRTPTDNAHWTVLLKYSAAADGHFLSAVTLRRNLIISDFEGNPAL